MRKRMYSKGSVIWSLDSLAEELDAGRWVFLRDRPIHHGFIMNMGYRTVQGFLRKGLIARAVRDADHP